MTTAPSVERVLFFLSNFVDKLEMIDVAQWMIDFTCRKWKEK